MARVVLVYDEAEDTIGRGTSQSVRSGRRGTNTGSIGQRGVVQHYALIIAKVHTTRARQSDSASYAVAENCYGIFHAEAVRVGVACEVQGHY